MYTLRSTTRCLWAQLWCLSWPELQTVSLVFIRRIGLVGASSHMDYCGLSKMGHCFDRRSTYSKQESVSLPLVNSINDPGCLPPIPVRCRFAHIFSFPPSAHRNITTAASRHDYKQLGLPAAIHYFLATHLARLVTSRPMRYRSFFFPLLSHRPTPDILVVCAHIAVDVGVYGHSYGAYRGLKYVQYRWFQYEIWAWSVHHPT